MPENSIILHIGYPKTGTTWFQNVFFPKVRNFRFLGYNDLPAWIFDDISGISKVQLTAYQKSLQNNDWIVSAEKMVGNIHNMYSNPKKYMEIFPNARILILLREQIDKFASNYSHHVLMGGTCSVKEFLFPSDNRELFNGQKHKYDQLLDSYIEVFGEDRVHVFLYEEFKNQPEVFMKKFIREFGLNVQYTSTDLLNLQNIRLSNLGFQVMRGLNHFTRDIPVYHKKSSIPKEYYFHIPYLRQLSNRGVSFLNQNGVFGKRFETDSLLGTEYSTFLKEYFSESNRKLITNHNLEQIREFNYSL